MVSFSYQSEWLGDSRTSSTSEPPPTTEPASSTWPSQTLANSETRPQKTAKEPFCMTKTSVVFHGSFGFVALVGSQTHRTGRLLYKSNSGSLPGTAGGSPIDL